MPLPSNELTVDLRNAIVMVARALDYVGVDDCNHGHRVGYIAYECAKRLDWPAARQEFVLLAGLIHDCGVSASSEHAQLTGELEPDDVEEHCIRGQEYLTQCEVLSPFAKTVRLHHRRWEKLKTLRVDDDDRDAAALVFLADRVDVLRAWSVVGHATESVVLHERQIADALRAHAGTLFRPEYAEAMAELVQLDGFWYMMEPDHIEELVHGIGSDAAYRRPLTIDQTTELATFIARIVDAKSRFTYEHSQKVADIAERLAEEFDFDPNARQQIRIAGLLHDLGKLRVPDSLLHKPGRLTDEERATLNRHVIDTKRALESCFGGTSIAEWASNHHEKLDGSGYPYRLTGEALDLPSRIIAVADIFQALAQDRPYLGRLHIDQILEIMVPMADHNTIDARVLDRIRRQPEAYYRLAI